jgi:hypothetical protein
LEKNVPVSPSSQSQVEQVPSSSIESIAQDIIQSEFNSTQFTQSQQEELVMLLTQILEDIFHVENRLLRLLLQDHSAFKAFAFAFTQAIFVYDKDDKAAVEKFLQSHSMTWDHALQVKKTAVHRRVRRYVPPPDVLCPTLQKLFDCWKDVPCSLDPEKGPLFNQKARKQAENILHTARQGFLSDPPGIPLYYKIGVDRNGLNYYRTVRGTNSIEGGIHMPLRRTFGSLNASPELTDALLCNYRDRRNTTVCIFFCLLFHSH